MNVRIKIQMNNYLKISKIFIAQMSLIWKLWILMKHLIKLQLLMNLHVKKRFIRYVRYKSSRYQLQEKAQIKGDDLQYFLDKVSTEIAVLPQKWHSLIQQSQNNQRIKCFSRIVIIKMKYSIFKKVLIILKKNLQRI